MRYGQRWAPTNGKTRRQPTRTINNQHTKSNSRQQGTNKNHRQRHLTIYSQHSTDDTRQQTTTTEARTGSPGSPGSPSILLLTEVVKSADASCVTSLKMTTTDRQRHHISFINSATLPVTNLSSTSRNRQFHFYRPMSYLWPTMSINKFVGEYVE